MSQPPVDPLRRRALLSSSARVGLLLGAGGLAACQVSGMSDRALKFASLAEAERALARLQAAVRAFSQWSGPLQPHFAYGALDKPRYEQAHAMHLANHLSAFEGRV